MLGERMIKNNMIGCNDKTVFKNERSVGECKFFECRQFKFKIWYDSQYRSK
jgi:hypothetical protein